MASLKGSSIEVVQELLKLISKPSHQRGDHEVELMLPWLCKKSALLQNQTKSVLSDIVKNCTLLSCYNDDVIIKQGDRGDSFYIILRGSASVYIDPRMTGEGSMSEGAQSTRASAGKRKARRKSRALATEGSVLSGMEKPSEGSETQGEEGGVGSLTDNEEAEEEEEDEEGLTGKKPAKLLAPLDRTNFGKFIVKYGPGSTFGEIALVNKDTFRNASVITDEDTDLMVIDQDLFDRSLRAQEEARYAEIREFVHEHPFFKDMNQKFKKLLEMSIRKEKYVFDTYIVKQGDPVTGLHFFISGSANISIQPKKHQTQYPHLWPFEAGVDQIAIEFEHLREARRAAILRKYEDPAVWETKPEELVIRREQGYAAIEKKMKENHINLCSVQSKEVLGDVEMLINLGTYMQTVRCSSDTQCFVLDTKNFERLITNKKNVSMTMQVMREYVKNKLHTRMNMRQAELIPLLGYLHQKLSEQLLPQSRKVEPFKTTKAIPDADEEMQHLLQYFKEGKEVVLIKPSIPGAVYYKELMREKANARAQQRKVSKASDAIKLGSVYKNRHKRQPRSMLQIRESLKQMMEAEVIEMESRKFRKKRRAEKAEKEKESDTFERVTSPKTLIGMQKKRPKSKKAKKGKENKEKKEKKEKEKEESQQPGLIAIMKAVAERRDSESTPRSDLASSATSKLAANPNLPKSTPPVFVTEASKAELKLPAIREENTQDDIVVTPVNGPKSPNPAVKSNVQDNVKAEPDVPDAIIIDPSTRKRPDDKSDSNTSKSPSLKPTGKNGSSTDPASESETMANLKADIPKLPVLQSDADNEDVDEEDDNDTSDNWQTAITFVNQRIQNRLAKSLLEEDAEYKDFETSEPSLKLLENRIQAFNIKYGMGQKTKNLPQLKRFKLDQNAGYVQRPKPGGRVWVKKQTCKFSDSEYLVKDHKHIRYKMVDSIPEFDLVNKTKIVAQQILKNANYT